MPDHERPWTDFAPPNLTMTISRGVYLSQHTAEFCYKDANRERWKVSLIRTRSEPAPPGCGDLDFWWEYALSKEDETTGVYVLVLSGELLGQCDERPRFADVMNDIACRMVKLAIEIAMFADRREDRPPRPPPP